ncbi:MAG: phosphonate ABC transporter ATP-binding protein [Paracoccaceae bacterium]
MNAPLASGLTAGSVPAEPAVAIRDLAKSFGGRTVLAGLGFAVAAGEALSLIGANGSGKSTLLRCLIRLTEPDAGSVRIAGREVTSLSARDLRRFRSDVGVVWQKHNLVPRLSALTNVVHGVQARMSGPRSWYQSLAPAEVRAEALRCLARVDLADRAEQRVSSLSGGQSQRVAIARMLMQRPRLILADEPDASLDPQSGEDVMRLLSGLAREEGLTLIVVSHRLEHATAFSDRIIGLADGRIALDMPAAGADPDALRRFFDHHD